VGVGVSFINDRGARLRRLRVKSFRLLRATHCCPGAAVASDFVVDHNQALAQLSSWG